MQTESTDSQGSLNILLVEDHIPDIVLTKKAFEKGALEKEIHVVRDGEEALDFLNNREGYKDAVKPDLVLLDINLPKKSGYEVLAEMKSSEELKEIPVIMLTSSSAESDITDSIRLKANSYLVKPEQLEDFYRLTNFVEGFWKNFGNSVSNGKL